MLFLESVHAKCASEFRGFIIALSKARFTFLTPLCSFIFHSSLDTERHSKLNFAKGHYTEFDRGLVPR